MTKMTEVIVPAQPGYTAIYIGDRPEDDGCLTMRDPVIAWAIASEPGRIDEVGEDSGVCWVVPITTSGTVSATSGGVRRWVIRRPDGVYDVPNDGSYETLAEAAAEVRERIERMEQHIKRIDERRLSGVRAA